MGAYESYCTYGNVHAGEYEFVLKPKHPRPANVGVLMYHGSGHPFAAHDPVQPYSAMLAALIAEAGIPVVTAEFGGQAWGNPAAMTYGDNAITRMNAVCGTRTDVVLCLGGSMGGYSALRYAKTNPAKVLAVAGIIPLTNMTYFYPNLGAAVEIATAWGVVSPAALPSASQIQEVAASFAMPIKLWYSSSDVLIRPADTTAFAAANPTHITAVNVGTHGHSDLTVADVLNQGAGRGADVIAFLEANGA